MKRPTDDEMRAKLASIDADPRYHYPAARMDINAPLAILQIVMKTEAQALAWALGVKPPVFGPRKKSKKKKPSSAQT